MAEKFVFEFALWGGLGGFVSVLVKHGYFELPHAQDKKLYLGGLTGVILGAVAGLIGDSNSLNAFMWGTGGSAILQGLVTLTESRATKAFKGE